ncbi:MAG: polyphosphate polymerase domain-containing protein [Oscillospiraceae bacterium]|nr:polyphosphate polymerase domain-containing protein [Oscillospiraceae bacterium]
MEIDANRYEIKYLLSGAQRDALVELLGRRMAPDVFPQYLVQNFYYDTDGWDAARASLNQPAYKEKLRLRCYGVPAGGSELHLELKRKYKGVVSKRRVSISAGEYAPGRAGALLAREDSQAAREMAFYLQRGPIREKAFLAYQRRAYVGIARENLRVTLDTDIRFRPDRLDFLHPDAGLRVLPSDMAVLEVKTPDNMPLWLSRALSGARLYPVPYSKYGVCYIRYILQAPERNISYA